jgi:hypothetical protein
VAEAKAVISAAVRILRIMRALLRKTWCGKLCAGGLGEKRESRIKHARQSRGGTASATPIPGPDAAGYTGVGIPNNLRDISSSGTFLSLADDQVSAAIPLGFSFDFYGNTYTQAYVSSNGFITFNNSSADGCCSGQPLPTVPFTANVPSNIVAGLWTDLNNPQGNIRYETLGVPGSLEFVVGFYNDQFCCGSGVANTFEMILHEGSNAIELQYGTLGVSPSGLIVSSGIENDGGTIGLQVFNGVSGTTEQAALQNRGFLISQTGLPEPTTLSLIGLGLLGLGAMAWRRRSLPLVAQA